MLKGPEGQEGVGGYTLRRGILTVGLHGGKWRKNNSLLGNFYAHAQCTRRFRFSLVDKSISKARWGIRIELCFIKKCRSLMWGAKCNKIWNVTYFYRFDLWLADRTADDKSPQYLRRISLLLSFFSLKFLNRYGNSHLVFEIPETKRGMEKGKDDRHENTQQEHGEAPNLWHNSKFFCMKRKAWISASRKKSAFGILSNLQHFFLLKIFCPLFHEFEVLGSKNKQN